MIRLVDPSDQNSCLQVLNTILVLKINILDKTQEISEGFTVAFDLDFLESQKFNKTRKTKKKFPVFFLTSTFASISVQILLKVLCHTL